MQFYDGEGRPWVSGQSQGPVFRADGQRASGLDVELSRAEDAMRRLPLDPSGGYQAMLARRAMHDPTGVAKRLLVRAMPREETPEQHEQNTKWIAQVQADERAQIPERVRAAVASTAERAQVVRDIEAFERAEEDARALNALSREDRRMVFEIGREQRKRELTDPGAVERERLAKIVAEKRAHHVF